MARFAGTTLALLAVLVLSGCGGGLRSVDAATDVATRFAAALSASEGERACGLLTPTTSAELEQSSGKPCASALLEEVDPPTPTAQARVYGTAAIVTTAQGPVFLTRSSAGWRVVALGCAPVPSEPSGPYDCTVQGG